MQADRVLLEHIRSRIARIQEYTGGNRARFYESNLVEDAVLRNLQVIAESTQRLSDQLKATEPGVSWRAISGFRNVLVHDYFGIDVDAVWSVVEVDLPVLSAAIQRMEEVARAADRTSKPED